jgi:hypothetical protein
LTRAFLKDDFNPNTPDVEGISYYSIAGDANPAVFNPLYLPYKNTHRMEGTQRKRREGRREKGKRRKRRGEEEEGEEEEEEEEEEK